MTRTLEGTSMRSVTLDDLIAALTRVRANHPGDTPVVVSVSPTDVADDYNTAPLQYLEYSALWDWQGVVLTSDLQTEDDDDYRVELVPVSRRTLSAWNEEEDE
jgi:hypothetical protein